MMDLKALFDGLKNWQKIALGASAGPVALLILVAPIEIVYQIGGTYGQAMLATAAWWYSLLGAGWATASILTKKSAD